MPEHLDARCQDVSNEEYQKYMVAKEGNAEQKEGKV